MVLKNLGKLCPYWWQKTNKQKSTHNILRVRISYNISSDFLPAKWGKNLS